MRTKLTTGELPNVVEIRIRREVYPGGTSSLTVSVDDSPLDVRLGMLRIAESHMIRHSAGDLLYEHDLASGDDL